MNYGAWVPPRLMAIATTSRHWMKSFGRMAAMHADTPEIIVPDVIPEATTRRVLTMGFSNKDEHQHHVDYEADMYTGITTFHGLVRIYNSRNWSVIRSSNCPAARLCTPAASRRMGRTS